MFVRSSACGAAAALVVLTSLSPAWAQDEDDSGDEESTLDEGIEESDDGEVDLTEAESDGDDLGVTKERRERMDEPKERPFRLGAAEEPEEVYMFVGARYRVNVVPKFLQNMFVKGGETVSMSTPGAEFIIREDRFEYGMFAMVSFMDMNNVPYEGDDDVEVISTDISIIYLGSDFTMSTPEFARGLSATFGGGAGIGIVAGDMSRTEAYHPGGLLGDIDGYERCPAPGFAPTCDALNPTNDDIHYDYVEPSVPPVLPWLSAQMGLRYKLHKRFVMHAEVGITLFLPGAFIGFGADYGL